MMFSLSLTEILIFVNLAVSSITLGMFLWVVTH